jgi:hypothetical protein
MKANMEPFQEQFVVVLPVGVANDGTFKTGPAGKRLVIEHVSVDADPAAAQLANYYITSTIEDNSTFREVPIVTALTASGRVIGSHPLRAYANPGTEFGAVIRRLDTSQRITASFVLAGYYVPFP